jgi:WD40 repeat protein
MYLAAVSRGDRNSVDNKVINIYSSETLALEFQLCGHAGKVNTLCFSSDGSRLFSGSEDRTVRIWCLSTQRELQTLPVTSAVWSLNICLDRLITKDSDGRAMVWDLTTGKSVLTLSISYRFSVGAYFSADGSMIVSGTVADTSYNRFYVRDTQTGKHKCELCDNAARPFLSLAVSPNPCMISASGMAATGYEDGTVCLWNLASKCLQASATSTLTDFGGVTTIAFNSDGTRLASGSITGNINVWDTSESTLLPLRGLVVPDRTPILILSFDSSGRQLACSTTSHTVVNLVFIFDLETEGEDIDPVHRLSNHFYATFSPASLVLM